MCSCVGAVSDFCEKFNGSIFCVAEPDLTCQGFGLIVIFYFVLPFFVPFVLVQWLVNWMHERRERVRQINGNNGEFTNTDDVDSNPGPDDVETTVWVIIPDTSVNFVQRVDDHYVFHANQYCDRILIYYTPGEGFPVLEPVDVVRERGASLVPCSACGRGLRHFRPPGLSVTGERLRIDPVTAVTSFFEDTPFNLEVPRREMIAFTLRQATATGARTNQDLMWLALSIYRGSFDARQITLRTHAGNVRGGMITKRAKHQGLGGKSKLNKDPQPKSKRSAADARLVAALLDNPKGKKPKTWRVRGTGSRPAGTSQPASTAPQPPCNSEPPALPSLCSDGSEVVLEEMEEPVDCDHFVAAKHPNCETLHRFVIDVSDLYHIDPLVVARSKFFTFDCHGTPFCGYTCIDVATGHVPDREEYEKLLLPSGDPLDIGTYPFLTEYASSRGVNLVIHQVLNGADVVIYQFMNSPEWKTVHLLFVRDEQQTGDTIDGHFYLYCKRQTSNAPYKMPRLPHGKVPNYSFFSLIVLFWVAVILFMIHFVAGCGLVFLIFLTCTRDVVSYEVKIRMGSSDSDVRNFMARRDKIETQDYYAFVERVVTRYVLNFPYREILDESGHRKEYEISVVRFVQGYWEIQCAIAAGVPADKAVAGIGVMTGINTDSSISKVMVDTAELLKDCYGALPKARSTIADLPAVAYNAPGDEVYVPNIPVIAANQVRGGKGFHVNHVIRYTLKPPVKNKPVAVCPVKIVTNHGVMGVGRFSKLDAPGLLVAFCGRSMSSHPKNDVEVAKFVEFSKKFISRFVDGTDFTGMVEPDCLEAFVAHATGKKPKAVIDRIAQEYTTFRDTGRCSKKFLKHGCFEKGEANQKYREVDGVKKQLCRPRLIMTMSDRMLVECCPVLKLFERWNHGPFSRYQVKDMTPEEMIERITHVSRGLHCTTDYSSWEASLDWTVRSIENFTMLRMCKRAGFNETARSLRRHVFTRDGGRVLESKWGKFKIYTRCSGDYWTSFGNGVINVCLMAYCAHKAGLGGPEELFSRLEVLAEGDDGLVDQTIPNERLLNDMGFKYSMNISGNKPGDCDFLRSRWIEGKRYLNIGKCFASLWIKNAAHLKKSKQMFLLRCMGNSLYHMSPGHPVLTALVNRIGKETAGYTTFKNYARYLNRWKGLGLYAGDDVPRYVEVDETMRAEIARGATGFPPLAVWLQIELERRIEDDHIIYVGNLLDSSAEFMDLKLSNDLLEVRDSKPSEEFLGLVRALKLGR